LTYQEEREMRRITCQKMAEIITFLEGVIPPAVVRPILEARSL